MFGLSRVRVAVVAAVIASLRRHPGAAYGLATPTTTSTTSTTIGGPPIPTPGSTPTTTPPATGPTTTTTIPPPPAAMPAFTLPTDVGPPAAADDAAGEGRSEGGRSTGSGPRSAASRPRRRRTRAARREQKRLEAVARRTQQKLDDTRTLLHQAAAEAYIHAGDAQLMNAISGYLNTTSAVDAGSQLHVLGHVRLEREGRCSTSTSR